MAGTYPSSPVFESIDFQINTPSQTVESFSGLLRRIGMNVQFYTFSAKYSSLTRRDFVPVLAFLSAQSGPVDSFQIVLPEISYPKGTNYASIGTPVVAGSALVAGAKTCTISGLVADKSQILRAGDMFKFANHTKCYMVVNDVDSDGSGQATLNFSGGLVSGVPLGTGITTTAVPFTVCLDGPIQEYSVGNGGISTMSVGFREVWGS